MPATGHGARLAPGTRHSSKAVTLGHSVRLALDTVGCQLPPWAPSEPGLVYRGVAAVTLCTQRGWHLAQQGAGCHPRHGTKLVLDALGCWLAAWALNKAGTRQGVLAATPGTVGCWLSPWAPSKAGSKAGDASARSSLSCDSAAQHCRGLLPALGSRGCTPQGFYFGGEGARQGCAPAAQGGWQGGARAQQWPDGC